MKVQAIHYKGIEFVSFHQLPAGQQLLLQHNTGIERINILMDGKIYRDCIQYEDYCNWFSSVFKSARIQQHYTIPVEPVLPKDKLSEETIGA